MEIHSKNWGEQDPLTTSHSSLKTSWGKIFQNIDGGTCLPGSCYLTTPVRHFLTTSPPPTTFRGVKKSRGGGGVGRNDCVGVFHTKFRSKLLVVFKASVSAVTATPAWLGVFISDNLPLFVICKNLKRVKMMAQPSCWLLRNHRNNKRTLFTIIWFFFPVEAPQKEKLNFAGCITRNRVFS